MMCILHKITFLRTKANILAFEAKGLRQNNALHEQASPLVYVIMYMHKLIYSVMASLEDSFV